MKVPLIQANVESQLRLLIAVRDVFSSQEKNNQVKGLSSIKLCLSFNSAQRLILVGLWNEKANLLQSLMTNNTEVLLSHTQQSVSVPLNVHYLQILLHFAEI